MYYFLYGRFYIINKKRDYVILDVYYYMYISSKRSIF